MFTIDDASSAVLLQNVRVVFAYVEKFFRQREIHSKETVVAVQVTGRTRRLGHDMKGLWNIIRGHWFLFELVRE